MPLQTLPASASASSVASFTDAREWANDAGMDQQGTPIGLIGAGGSIPGTDRAAFRFSPAKQARLPIVVAVPHAGRVYSDDIRDRMRDPHNAQLRLEDRYIDLVGAELAQRTGAALLIADAPRALLDLNRSPEDVDWGMVKGVRGREPRHSLTNRRARSGLGLVPGRLPGSGEIWRKKLEPGELEQRIDAVHTPYHRVLANMLEALRDDWGAALLVDLHSMPPLRGQQFGDPPAEFVLGDRFGASCDHRIVAQSLNFLSATGRAVSHNRPYAGGYILDRHGAPRRNIHAMQIEVCRTTYLDARLDQPSARLPAITKLLSALIQNLGSMVADMGSQNLPRQAAE